MDRKTIIGITLACCLVLLNSGSIQAQYAAETPFETARLAEFADENGLVPVLILMDDEGSRRQVAEVASARNLSRSNRIKSVTSRLQSFRSHGAVQVEAFLNDRAGSEIKKFWIVPAYSATLSQDDIDALSIMDGVANIVPDVSMVAFEPVDSRDVPQAAAAANAHLTMIRVPEVWAQGLTGKGRLVCSFDTGVEQAHPALMSKWRGNHASLSSSWFSTFTPNALPTDRTGHGTHTTGVMVGSTPADTFGVAPDAEWIAAGVIDQGRNLSGTFSDILAAYQWALNPDGDPNTTDDVPDVINNSWGVPKGVLPVCDKTFWQAIDNVEAAGIVAIFAAGNEGPGPATLRTPADRATTATNTFAVGAVYNDKAIASFSSRGPGGCDGTAVKPDIVAPGYQVYSSFKGGIYRLMDGTSMAAPFISGLVAICRQYSPDASVEDIKWAIINSAQDLGAAGKDNAYGHGLVDAVRMLELLPTDPSTPYTVVESTVEGDGIAFPGETVDLNLTITRSIEGPDTLVGYLDGDITDNVEVVFDRSEFNFDELSAAVTTQPFTITISPDAIQGRGTNLQLSLEDTQGNPIQDVVFSLFIGHPVPGRVAEHESAAITMTVSDFGQFGFGNGSIYNLDRSGFIYNQSANLLYEAGVMVSVDDGRLASSVRDSAGVFRPSDFLPTTPLTAGWADIRFGFHRRAAYADSRQTDNVPIRIWQETVDFSSTTDDNIVLFRFELENLSIESFENVNFGFLADFDLDTAGDQIMYQEERGLLLQTGTQGPMIGLVALNNLASLSALENAGVKTGLTRTDQIAVMSSEGAHLDEQVTGDLMFVASTGSISLEQEETAHVAFALVAAADLSELMTAADRARNIYDSVTRVEGQLAELPDDFELWQNYPNPFNPTTTISFLLRNSEEEVELTVYNVLGQTVRQLHSDALAAGAHAFEWDATTENGRSVASGVYFYRLETENGVQSKKMVLLK
jgi:hypothetical protein